MASTINLYNIFGSEIRSRSNADILRQSAADLNNAIMDLTGITFISRSFADEMCNLIETHHITLLNCSDIVQNMINVVLESRKHTRVRKLEHAEIKEFTDMKSLSAFLSTI